MDIFLDILFTLGIIIGVIALIVGLLMGFIAIVYENFFKKRVEIYDAKMLPSFDNYPNLEFTPVVFENEKRKFKYHGGYYTDKRAGWYKGLVVFSHGIFEGHISYLPEIEYFARNGYKVFAYDNCGSHLSGGKGLRGLPQAVEDLDIALQFVTKDNSLPLFLAGHSLGGHSVCAVFCRHDYNVKAVFSQSGFNRSYEALLEEGSKLVGKWLVLLKGYLRVYERMKFGKEAGYTAGMGVMKATKKGTKFFILYSLDDDTVSLSNSVLANVDKNKKIKLLSEKTKGHNSLDSDNAIKHKKELDARLLAEYPKGYKLSERREFYKKNADPVIYFEKDEKLLGAAVSFFDKAL